ncbi:flocculation protein FLO11 isoform X2 [Scleropages formosus]|uniref:flocculation protein FLO11 isoform X2 n=1 Tax=Scleropages formosus TaxID=113540 RepID=UPI0010FAC076|nr:flocculation protein FLO11-like isoform X2 [Scleropages formosus]
MRHTELSVIMYLPSLLAFSATTLSSTTAEPFSRSTTLTSEALTAGAKTERPNPQNMSTNRDPSAETAKQDSFASERMTTPASRHRPSERSGVTKVVEFRARTVESNPWKNPAETPYATSGQGATTQHNLRAHREPTAGNMETTAHRQESPETSSSHMDARAMGDPRPAPATYSSTTWDKRSTAPANHNTTGPVATSTVELHSNTYTGLHASADTHRTPTAYNMATEREGEEEMDAGQRRAEHPVGSAQGDTGAKSGVLVCQQLLGGPGAGRGQSTATGRHRQEERARNTVDTTQGHPGGHY